MTALKPRGMKDLPRDHHDFDAFMTNLPPSHRDAARRLSPHLNTPVIEIALFERMVLETQCTEIGNMVQLCIAQKVANEHVLTREDLMTVRDTIDLSYARALEVLDCVQTDFAGPKLVPYGCFLRHYGATIGGKPDPGRTALSERKHVMQRIKHVDPRKIERVWIFSINHADDYEGGEIYFPTKKTALKLTQGAGVIFSPRLPYGIAPVTKGVRRLFCGWAATFNPKWQGLTHHVFVD